MWSTEINGQNGMGVGGWNLILSVQKRRESNVESDEIFQ